ncbi:MAG: threonylcarbamoyl-AMP synthase [Candidatus Zixiibacteriota bacterium]|nr:MAG: threonylcarbamoyl-AMP synthase [candidate division Zixibacteria bacterium]
MNSPRIEVVDFTNPDPALVSRVASLLEEGRLVVAPTETRYGLMARADRPETLNRLYNVKGRPAEMPTAIFAADIEAVWSYGKATSAARRIAEKFLPGPLTLVLEARRDLGSPIVVDGKIGVRVSSAPFITMLLGEVVFPVTATSANLSGGDDIDTIEEIARVFGGKVDLYLDSGTLDNPVSTVVDAGSDSPVVLREGAIPADSILSLLKSQLI